MDDDSRRRLGAVEDDVRSLRRRVDLLSESVNHARRESGIALERLEDAMSADVAEAKRVDVRFNHQDEELRKQTRMLERLDLAEQRRATESMRIKAVREDEEKKKALREKRIDRILKLWPIVVTLVPAIIVALTWLAAHWK